jgi:hypothetical protein
VERSPALRYRFHAVRSARDEIPEPGTGWRRRSHSCAERPDLTLFVWREGDEGVVAWQLLFGECFVDWSRSAGLAAGTTDRVSEMPDPGRRRRGVRTLAAVAGSEQARILAAGAELLARSGLPDGLDAIIRIEPPK